MAMRTAASGTAGTLLSSGIDLPRLLALPARILESPDFHDDPEATSCIDLHTCFRNLIRSSIQAKNMTGSELEVTTSRLRHALVSQGKYNLSHLIREFPPADLIPPVIQFARDGSNSYLVEDDVAQTILSTDDPLTYLPLPHDAFEISWKSPAMARRLYEARHLLGGLKSAPDSFEGAYASALFSRIVTQDGAAFIRVDGLATYPKGGRAKGLRIGFRMPQDSLVSGDPEIREGILPKDQDLPIYDPVDAFRAFCIPALKTALHLARGDLEALPARNEYAIMKARTLNKDLPRRTRERAVQDLERFPNAPVRKVIAGPDFSVAHGAPSRTEPQPEENLVVRRRGKAADLFTEAYPNRMMQAFSGLGDGKLLNSESHLRKLRLNTALRLQAEEDCLPLTEEPREILMDQSALDLIDFEDLDDMEGVMAIYSEIISRMERSDRPMNAVPMTGLMRMHGFLKAFRDGNRHCFLLDADVADVLSKTDIDGITTEDVRLPFSSFFLGFRDGIPMQVDGQDILFEGSLIRGTSQGIDFLMCFSPQETSGIPLKDLVPPIQISIPVRPGLFLEDAILEAIDGKGYDIERMPPPEIDGEARAFAEANGIRLVIPRRSSQDLTAERNEQAFDTVVEAIGIVVNTILLLNARPEQIRLDQVRTVTDEIADAIASASAEERRRALLLADTSGMSPVRLITLTEDAREDLEERRRSVRGSPSVIYDRKGYFRMQAYGRGRALRRMVWIEPTICNIKAGVRAEGSVYLKRLARSNEESREFDAF